MSANFRLGTLVATPGAILDFGPALIAELLCRHAEADRSSTCVLRPEDY